MEDKRGNKPADAGNSSTEAMGKKASVLWLIAAGNAVVGWLTLLKGTNVYRTEGTFWNIQLVMGLNILLLAVIVGAIAYRLNNKVKALEKEKEKRK